MKRGGYLQRRTPLRRSWIKRRAPRRLAKRAAARPWLAFVRSLPCIWCLKQGPSEASHVTLGPNEKGVGMKVNDGQVVPHCRRCHRHWDQRSGYFAGLTREQRWKIAASWVRALRLAATPGDSFDSALELAELGLGRVEGDAQGWKWIPLAEAQALVRGVTR